MYLLDPAIETGAAPACGTGSSAARHLTGHAMDAKSGTCATGRAAWSELRARLIPEDVSDDVLNERVRARLGQTVRYARSIDTSVANGCVTLRGPVLAVDVARVVRRVGQVPGVREIDSRLDVHAEPGMVPGLQGARASSGGAEVLELMQGALSPRARLATGIGGALLALWGLRRLDAAGLPVATIGMALLARGAGKPKDGYSRPRRGNLHR